VVSTENSVGDVAGSPRYSIIRGLINFDTSALGATSTITAATVSLTLSQFPVDRSGPFGFQTDYIRLVPNTIVSNVNYATTDYGLIGTVAQGPDILVADLSFPGAAAWTLNSTGLGNISKTGITHFGVRLGSDIDNVSPVQGTDPSFPLVGGALVFFDSSENTAGTATDPTLVVTYTPGSFPRKGDFFFPATPLVLALPRTAHATRQLRR